MQKSDENIFCMYLLSFPPPKPSIHFKFFIHFKLRKWKELSKMPDFSNGTLHCITWRQRLAPRAICLLHKDRLLGLVEVTRVQLGSWSVGMLSGQETHGAAPSSFLGYVCPAIIVLMFYLVEFYKRDPRCGEIWMQCGCKRTRYRVSMEAVLLDNENSPYTL